MYLIKTQVWAYRYSERKKNTQNVKGPSWTDISGLGVIVQLAGITILFSKIDPNVNHGNLSTMLIFWS